MLVVALCNQKGGVGKTTTAVNIARAAYLRSFRTLVVDLDPQANTTTTLLGDTPDPSAETIADVLSARSDATLADVVTATGWDGVEVSPSGGDALADVGSELVTMGPGREHRLREALTAAERSPTLRYDLVLLDCPPALDLLTINALTASAKAIVVTTASLFSSDGIARLLRTVGAVKQYLNPQIEVCGVIVNAFERSPRRQRHWLDDLRKNAPAPVWEPPVPKATWVAEAIEAGVGLDEWGTPAATVLMETYDQYLKNIVEGTTAG